MKNIRKKAPNYLTELNEISRLALYVVDYENRILAYKKQILEIESNIRLRIEINSLESIRRNHLIKNKKRNHSSYFRCSQCELFLNKKESYNKMGTYCKACHKAKRKSHYVSNKEQTKQTVKIYNKTYCSQYFKRRRKTDPMFRLISNIRSRNSRMFKTNVWKKDSNFRKYIGCDKETLIKHFEGLFEPGMTWGNYGKYGWHVDHVIPISSATSEMEAFRFSHYTNLQPLWAKDNLEKGAKLPFNK